VILHTLVCTLKRMDIFKFPIKANKEKAQQEEQQLAESLNFLENVLKEEDPDFVNSLVDVKKDEKIAAIKEDPTKKELQKKVSILESAVELNLKQNSFIHNFAQYLKQPFLIKQNPKKVIAFWLLVGVVITLATYLVKSHFWHSKEQLFVHSYEEWGVKAESYDPTVDVDSYFDNPNFSKNIMTLSKLTTNILPTDNSSENPMVSYEVVIESLSNEAIIEIKDREAEFRDMVLRTVEEFNYDELVEADGKQKLGEMTTERINAALTKSQIRRVFYNNFIVKY